MIDHPLFSRMHYCIRKQKSESVTSRTTVLVHRESGYFLPTECLFHRYYVFSEDFSAYVSFIKVTLLPNRTSKRNRSRFPHTHRRKIHISRSMFSKLKSRWNKCKLFFQIVPRWMHELRGIDIAPLFMRLASHAIWMTWRCMEAIIASCDG